MKLLDASQAQCWFRFGIEKFLSEIRKFFDRTLSDSKLVNYTDNELKVLEQ